MAMTVYQWLFKLELEIKIKIKNKMITKIAMRIIQDHRPHFHKNLVLKIKAYQIKVTK